jgi:hypothetical protein
MGFEGQDHQEKRHTNLMCDSQHKSHKETHPKPSHENPLKRLRKSPKKKKGIHKQITRGHKMNSKPSIHEKERFFTKRLVTSHHPTHLKIGMKH